MVLNVGAAHIGEFGSVEATARPRASWSRRCRPDGVGGAQRRRPAGRRDGGADRRPGWCWSARPPDADVRADRRDARRARAGPSYTLVTAGGRAPVRLGVAGRHQVGNTPRRGRGGAASWAWRWTTLAAALGELRHRVRPADGRLRPARRGDGHRRLVQRQPVLDRGRAARAGRDGRGPAHHRGARLHGRAGRVRARRARGGRPARRRAGRRPAGRGRRRRRADPRRRGRGRRAGQGRRCSPPTRRPRSRSLRADLRPGDVVLVKGSRYRTWDVADALRAGRGGSPREGSHRRGRGRVHHLAVRHAARDPGVHRAQGRPADPHRRPGRATRARRARRRWAGWRSSSPR